MEETLWDSLSAWQKEALETACRFNTVLPSRGIGLTTLLVSIALDRIERKRQLLLEHAK